MALKQKKVKIIIADDHAIVRKGLSLILSETFDLTVVGEAKNGNELMKKIREINSDMILLDVNMPGKSGWDILNQLRSEYPKLPVIILSVYPEEDYGLNFLKAGAMGYLNKSSAPEQLVKAIRKVSSGKKFISHRLAEQLVSDLGEDVKESCHESLSPREFQVFCMIASGKTVGEIAEELALSPPTISSYRTRVLGKMKMKNSAQLTSYAFRHKLIT